MADRLIRDERVDGTAVITLARPEKLNALTWGMLEDLLQRMRAAEADETVRAIVVRGEGRAFCTGFDLAAIAADAGAEGYHGPMQDQRSFQRAAAYWRAVWQIRKPVIAAVHGYCMAAGLEFVMHADFAIAADDALFGYPAVRASGLPDTHMFIYHIGPQWTRRLLMTGDTIDAATAERIGLVLETVPRAQLEDAALALARSVAQAPQPILEGVKSVVNQAIELMGYTALQRENWSQSAMARAAPEIQEFDSIAREQGLKAALAWRDGKAAKGAAQGEEP
jgi:enoyl-CoA hydratase